MEDTWARRFSARGRAEAMEIQAKSSVRRSLSCCLAQRGAGEWPCVAIGDQRSALARWLLARRAGPKLNLSSLSRATDGDQRTTGSPAESTFRDMSSHEFDSPATSIHCWAVTLEVTTTTRR